MKEIQIQPGPHRRKILPAAIAALAISAPVANSSLAQSDSGIEEVVVTGSLIPRSEGIVAASPLVQFSAEDIEAEGTINMAQVIQNLTFNNGTGVTNSIQGTTNQTATFNLRGLGTRATLPLIDGKRVPISNVQVLLPSMAMERIDIVTDGAAALYGTDAVAGVVNMVPYKSYDGFKLEAYEEQDSRGDYWRRETSFLAGRSFGDIDLVVAGSYQKNDALAWHDRPEYIVSGLTHNSGSNPGNFEVPLRDENGDLTGRVRNRPDPSCGLNEDSDQNAQFNSSWGNRALGRCWISFGDTRDFMEEINSTNLYGNLNWNYSEDISFNAQFLYNRQIVHGRQGPSNPGARVDELPTVRGELPGNTFRAVNSSGDLLFAEPLRDANGAIITDAYGNAQWVRDGNGQTVLAQNRYADFNADPLGGVPFYEDVRLGAWLPFGKPAINTHPQSFQENDGLNMELDDRRTARFSFGADFNVPWLEGWRGKAEYTYGYYHQIDVANQDFSFSAVEQGLNCDQINDADACFNPFAAQDARYRNSQQVADSIFTSFRENNRDELQTFDIYVTGELPLGFELPGGAIAAAVGYQRRDETDEDNPPAGDVANDQLIGNQEVPQTVNRFVNSWFAEFSFPILENLELSAAVRDESFSTGQGAVVDKYGIIYSPTNWLNLRATTGEAFIVPTLPQLNRPEQCGLNNVDDLFSSFSGFITSCTTGNPNLLSETSDSISAGFDLTLFDDLVWSVTWSETDFKDRIVSTTTQDIVRTDFANFQAATGFTPSDANPFPTEAQLSAWIANPLSDSRILRNPSDITTPVRINQSDSNASTMLVRAIDTQLSYVFSLDQIGLSSWGNVNFSLQATYVDTYMFQLQQDDPVLEAKGNQNNDFGAVPPIPEIRANLRVGWTKGQHSVVATGRYVDEVLFDANEFGFQRFLPGSQWLSTDVVEEWSQMDLFYSYRDFEALGGSFNFSVGARNLFDRMPQKTGMIAGVVASLQDPLGRVVYARVNYNF